MKPGTPYCKARVYPQGGPHLAGGFQCSFKSVKDGFCRIHHPDSEANRRAKSPAKFNEYLAASAAKQKKADELDRRAAAYPRLVEALRACISAASTDKVEDFSAVSNAADYAGELLRELGEDK